METTTFQLLTATDYQENTRPENKKQNQAKQQLTKNQKSINISKIKTIKRIKNNRKQQQQHVEKKIPAAY